MLADDGTPSGEVRLLRARNIVVATGARPRSIPGMAIDRERVITSTEAMTLERRPESLIVIGAGAIGIEFAYFYNALGTRVTVVEMLPSILPVEDRELTKELERSLKKQGIEILTGTRVQGVQRSANDVTVAVLMQAYHVLGTDRTGNDVLVQCLKSIRTAFFNQIFGRFVAE
jgi:dihydrolipoamide dehydrogenase